MISKVILTQRPDPRSFAQPRPGHLPSYDGDRSRDPWNHRRRRQHL